MEHAVVGAVQFGIKALYPQAVRLAAPTFRYVRGFAVGPRRMALPQFGETNSDYSLVATAGVYAHALRKTVCLDGQMLTGLISPREIKTLKNLCRDLLDKRDDYLVLDLEIYLLLAVAILQFLRFSAETDIVSDKESLELIRRSDRLALRAAAVDPKQYGRLRSYRPEQHGKVRMELFDYYLLHRGNVGTRRKLPPGGEVISREIGRVLSGNGLNGLYTLEARQRIGLCAVLEAIWSRGQSGEFQAARIHAEDALRRVNLVNIDAANRESRLYGYWQDDAGMQAELDLRTMIARVFGIKAGVLLADSVAAGSLGRVAQLGIRNALGNAERAFGMCKGICWHGYGNYVAAASLLQYLRRDFEAFAKSLDFASAIFARTSDPARQLIIDDINYPGRDFGSNPLSGFEANALVFRE